MRKFWFKNLEKLKKSEKTLRSVYESMLSFGPCVFFEWREGNTVRTTTYGEFARLSEQAAVALKNRVAAPRGSYIGLAMENCPEWVISFWALLMAGFRPVLLNTRMSPAQLDAVIAAVGARAVVTKTAVRDIDIAFESLAQRTTHNAQCTMSDNAERNPDNNCALGIEHCALNWEDVFALTTSGTTGAPRVFAFDGASVCALILSSEYFLRKNSAITYNARGDAKFLAFLPFYHIFGLITNLMWFGFFGRPFIFLPDYRPETIRYTCRRHGITHFFAIPLVWNGIASFVRREAAAQGQDKKLEKALKFSISLQNAFPRFGKWVARKMFRDVREKIFGDKICFCISGGGYLRDDALYVLNGLGYPLYNGYGMTEIGITSVELSKKAKQRIKGTVGKPFPGTEYDIGSDGTLLVRGGTVHFAEIKDGKEVARDPSAFFSTGDFFDRDKQGNYYIRGRSDEVIIAESGENLPPDAIEKKFDLAYAENFCVFGVHEDGTTRIILLIQPQKDISSAQLNEMLLSVYETDKKLPAAEKISKVLLTSEALPVSAGSKVQRALVREGYLSKSLFAPAVDLARYGDAGAVRDENYKKTLAEVQQVFAKTLNLPIESVGEHGNFLLDFGGGSLEYFSLLAELSKNFNVQFDITENYLATPAEFTGFIVKR